MTLINREIVTMPEDHSFHHKPAPGRLVVISKAMVPGAGDGIFGSVVDPAPGRSAFIVRRFLKMLAGVLDQDVLLG